MFYIYILYIYIIYYMYILYICFIYIFLCSFVKEGIDSFVWYVS